jgi:hypothetical protein
MDYHKRPTRILTAREHIHWGYIAPDEYWAWFDRMWKVQEHFEATGRRLPRHRFKSNPTKP